MEKVFDKSFLYFLILTTIIILFIINNSAFNNSNPTCNNFVVNVYLYLAVSVLSIGLFSYLINLILFGNSRKYFKPLESYEIFQNMNVFFYIFSAIMSLVLIVLIAISNGFENTNVIYNHIIWLLFLFFISVTLYPRLKDIDSYKYIDFALISTTVIFLVMTYFYYMFSDMFLNNMSAIGMGLLLSLVVIIIVELINIFFLSGTTSINLLKITSYIVILLFSIFVSYDTAQMAVRAEECTNLPNYPKFSIDFFLDLLNMFSRILFLSSKR